MIPTYRPPVAERKRLSERPRFVGVKWSPIIGESSMGLPSEAGVYTYDAVSRLPQHRQLSSAPACPYCKEPMKLIVATGLNRVVWVDDDPTAPRPALVAPLPSTHDAFSCKPCLQVFTVPR